jgi:hypothetical protein
LPSGSDLSKSIRTYQAQVVTDNDPIVSNILDTDDADLKSQFELRDFTKLKNPISTFLFDDIQRQNITLFINEKMKKPVERINIGNEEKSSLQRTPLESKKKKLESLSNIIGLERYTKDLINH